MTKPDEKANVTRQVAAALVLHSDGIVETAATHGTDEGGYGHARGPQGDSHGPLWALSH